MVHLLGSNIDNLMDKSSRTVSGLYLMSMSEKRFCEKSLTWQQIEHKPAIYTGSKEGQQCKEDMELLEWAQCRATKVIKGQVYLLYGEKWTEVRLFSRKKIRFGGGEILFLASIW